MTSLQEHDLEKNHAKIVKGQGLCRMEVKSMKDKRSEGEFYEDELYGDQILLEK